MDMLKEKDILERLISHYLNGEKTLQDLQKFSWNTIDYFSKINKLDLPPFSDFEQEFWYVIWQIQHLADEEHEKDGLTKKTLREAIEYLKGEQISKEY